MAKTLPAGTFEHAKIVDTRWGQVLAFIELRDDNDCECLRLQMWAPIADDGSEGQVTFRIGLDASAPDSAHDTMSDANRKALSELTPERAEAVIEKYGVGDVLDEAFQKAAAA
jgi:hypothetical protein